MKFFNSSVLCFLMAFSSLSVSLEVGDMAPDFSLQGSDGKTYSLEQYKGKQAIVIAWYPMAFTRGCTIECKSLAENGHLLKQFDISYFMASVDSLEKNTGALKNLFNYLSEESMLSGSMIGFYAKNNKIDASYINNLGIKINNRKIDLPKTNWDDFKNYKKSYLSPEGIETVIKDEFDSSPLLIFFPDGQNSGGQIRVELDSNIYIIDIDKNGNFETKYETY